MRVRILIWGVGTVLVVLIVVPIVHWPVALGVVKAVAACGVAALMICRRR
jgi:hypothetical protein